MDSKIKEIISSYEELLSKLSSPEIYTQPEKVGSLRKQLNTLENKYKLAKKYLATVLEIEEARLIMSTSESHADKTLYQDVINQGDILLSEIEHSLLTDGPSDDGQVREVILEIRAGSGGEEAALFAQDLLSMYINYSIQKGWQTNIISAGDAVLGGIKHVIVEISGDDCYSLLKFESGVHRVQRVPSTESAGRIHTSAASVVVFPKVNPADITIDPGEIEIYTYRSSGPGGQSVNTTDSAVRITHIPSGITVTCQDNKSQIKNREQAMTILKSKVLDMQQQQQDSVISDTRKLAIKTGDRSDKIRTYNFPQNRITDHRLSKSWHDINSMMKGNIDNMLNDVSTLSKVHN